MEKDYTKYSFRLTALVLALLIAVSFIPPFTTGGVKFKRANIISDIYKFPGDTVGAAEAKISEADKIFLKDMEALEAAIGNAGEGDGEPDAAGEGDSWNIGGGVDIAEAGGVPEAQPGTGTDPQDVNVIKIEDYTPEEGVSVADFCALLGTATQNRIVRIGFLGDSYIEGDIITADVRDKLQEAYGGGGVGFVPFETPLAANRPTVKHTYANWKNYNLIYKKNAPEDVKDRFYVSGIVSKPQEGAWSEYRTVNFRRNLPKVSTARLIFTNTAGSSVNMVVNDSMEREFTPEISEQVQQINVSGGRIVSLKVSVEQPEGFYGYGVVLEGSRGISVDNYSIRGNSGLALFGTSSAVNSRIDRTLGYDLIVLQYGLNIMQADVTGYGGYGQQLRKIINYMKTCFPKAAIIVMGVGDRSIQVDGRFETMPAVKGMVASQRAAAKDSGVAFWDTFAAMGGENGMNNFVEKGWAAKDYTHLSYSGGRKIAEELVKALEYLKRHADEPVGAVSGDASSDTNAMPQRVESLSSFEAVGDDESLRDNTKTTGHDTLKTVNPAVSNGITEPDSVNMP